MFSQCCSIYASAHDARGEFVDHETGELIQQMTIGEFLLSDLWKEKVTQLRDLVVQHGKSGAKELPEYRELKESLPGATLSALFSYRKQTDVVSHTGWFVLDVDWQDNKQLTPQSILMTLKDIPFVGLVMKSCSGTGYLALVKIAAPTEEEKSAVSADTMSGMMSAIHKARVRAFYEEYANIGINFDQKCSDITRLRFASYDDAPFLREDCMAYDGFQPEKIQLLPRQDVVISHEHTKTDAYELALKLIALAESKQIDISGRDYQEWVTVGMSLYSLGDYSLWQRVCNLWNKQHSNGMTEAEIRNKWKSFRGTSVNIGYFFNVCRQNGVSIYNRR